MENSLILRKGPGALQTNEQARVIQFWYEKTPDCSGGALVYGSIKGIIAHSYRKAIHLLKQVIGSSDSGNDGIEKAHPPVKEDELINTVFD